MNKTRDICERMAATFVQSFAAIFVVSDLGTAKAALTAAVAAALSVAKGWAATRLGSGSASLAD